MEDECERTGLDCHLKIQGHSVSAVQGVSQDELWLIRVLDEIGAPHVDTITSGCGVHRSYLDVSEITPVWPPTRQRVLS